MFLADGLHALPGAPLGATLVFFPAFSGQVTAPLSNLLVRRNHFTTQSAPARVPCKPCLWRIALVAKDTGENRLDMFHMIVEVEKRLELGFIEMRRNLWVLREQG